MKYFKKEHFHILCWILLLIVTPPAYRLFDAGAAPIDLGEFSGILFAVAAVMIFKNVAWLLIRSIWPDFAWYISTQLFDDFNKITPWERIKSSLLFYSFLIALMVVALRSFL